MKINTNLFLTSYSIWNNMRTKYWEGKGIIVEFKNFEYEDKTYSIICEMNSKEKSNINVINKSGKIVHEGILTDEDYNILNDIMRKFCNEDSLDVSKEEVYQYLKKYEIELLKPLIENGLKNNKIKLTLDDEAVMAEIGDYWFYAWEMDEWFDVAWKENQWEKKFESIPFDEKVESLAYGLIDLKEELNEIEYAYYVSILLEN